MPFPLAFLMYGELAGIFIQYELKRDFQLNALAENKSRILYYYKTFIKENFKTFIKKRYFTRKSHLCYFEFN